MTQQTKEIIQKKYRGLSFEGSLNDAVRSYVFLYALHESQYNTFMIHRVIKLLKNRGIVTYDNRPRINFNFDTFKQLISPNGVIQSAWKNNSISHYTCDQDKVEKYMILLESILLK